MPTFNAERAATILAEAEFCSDKQIINEYKIDRSTLWHWRKRLKSDPDFFRLFQRRKKQVAESWRDDAVWFMKASLRKLTELVQSDGNSKQIYAVAGALKIVGELKITGDALSESGADWQSQSLEET